jgi:hypothetical protein
MSTRYIIDRVASETVTGAKTIVIHKLGKEVGVGSAHRQPVVAQAADMQRHALLDATQGAVESPADRDAARQIGY